MNKISVIIATHNRPMLLKRALASLKQQTYQHQQIIVISDAIDEASYSVCVQLMQAEDLFIQRRGVSGPAESRNLGIKFATGDYLIFLDDDDTFEVDFLETFISKKNEYLSNEYIFYSNFKVVNEKQNGNNILTEDIVNIELDVYNPLAVYVKNFIPNNCAIYPRKLVSDIVFDPHISYEDWDFLLSACKKAPLKHLPIFGPMVHKNITENWEQRGKKNDDNLLECYIKIYTKHSAPNEFIQATRRELFKSINIDIEALLPNTVAFAHNKCEVRNNNQYDIQIGRDRLEQFDALNAGIIFTLWLGPYAMSPSRSEAVQSIFRDAGRPVCFITDASLPEWEHPDYPFHPAFRYLSEVHRADYLRCYLMHHYGGGYTDIKPVLQPWTSHFQVFNESNWLALGYPEISANAVAQLPGELGEQLRLKYAELIGYCSMIFRRRSILTTEWFEATHSKLDELLPRLQAHPAQHPMDQLGVTLPNGVVSEYPLRWTELGGNIFHPMILKYRDRVSKTLGIMPQLHNYR